MLNLWHRRRRQSLGDANPGSPSLQSSSRGQTRTHGIHSYSIFCAIIKVALRSTRTDDSYLFCSKLLTPALPPTFTIALSLRQTSTNKQMDTNKPSSSSTFFLPFSLSPSLSIYAIVFPMPLLYLPFIMTINIRPNLLIWHQTTFISADSLACCSHQFRPCCIKICEPFLFY